MDEFFALLSAFIPNTVYIVSLAAIFVRFSIFIFLLPGLGDTSVPARVRLIVALVITWILAPVILQAEQVTDVTAVKMAILFFSEAIIGFVLGFGFRISIFVLQITGTIIAQALSLSQVFGSALTEEPNTMVSTLLMLAGTTLALTMGLHIEAVRILLGSFDIFPLGTIGSFENLAYWAMQKCMEAFGFALSLALPFVVLNFLYNLMLGLINRAMPQLMVSFVGLPAITGVGLVLLAISIGAVLTVWVTSFGTVISDFTGEG